MIKETHFERLEQLLFKENRIITSKILSNELGVHVNEARRILTNFFDHQKTPLHSYHLITGTIDSDDAKSIVFKIATHDDLEDAKKDLTTLTGCHVYSLSTDKHDKNEVYSAERDYLSANEIKLNTSIKHPAIRIRQPVLIKANGVKVEAKVAPSKKHNSTILSNGKSEPSKTSIDVTLKKEASESVSVEQNGNGPNENSSKTSPEKVQKTNPLTAMWQKSENKPKSVKNDNSKSNSKKKTPPQGKNIIAMFSKQAQKNLENPVKPAPRIQVPEVQKPEVKPLPKPVKEEDDSDKEEKKPITVSKKRRSSKKVSKSSKMQDKDSSDEEFQSKKKKRRRICTVDSDSDSESEEAQDRAQRDLFLPEEVIIDTDCKKSSTLKSDDEEVISATPPVIIQKGKRKVWKNINKTFEEDGFLVTKKEKVLVSASESDEDPIPKEKSPVKEIVKPKANVARKQSSLTSFFTRK